jgi:hypothetical protein
MAGVRSVYKIVIVFSCKDKVPDDLTTIAIKYLCDAAQSLVDYKLLHAVHPSHFADVLEVAFCSSALIDDALTEFKNLFSCFVPKFLNMEEMIISQPIFRNMKMMNQFLVSVQVQGAFVNSY